MYTHSLEPSDRFSHIGAIDIETNGLDGNTDSLVAIATGYYDADTTEFTWAVHTRAACPDEPTLIRVAFSWLNDLQPAGIVTYNGKGFGLPFIRNRVRDLGVRDLPELVGKHVDLYPPRQQAASSAGVKWPRLEECLTAHGIPCYEITWNGDLLDNSRFGRELAPAYLAAVDQGDAPTIRELESVIMPYAGSDIEATIALYEADAGRSYTPSYSFEY